MPFIPVSSAPQAWRYPSDATSSSALASGSTEATGMIEPRATASAAPHTQPEAVQEPQDAHPLAQVSAAPLDSVSPTPPFSECVKKWLNTMLPPSHEAVASPLRAALMQPRPADHGFTAPVFPHLDMPYVDPEHVQASEGLLARRAESAERRARVQGFRKMDGSGDVRAMQRARLHRTVIAQGFVRPDGSADTTAYSKDLKVREFQRGLALRAAGKPLSEYWNYTLERFSRLAGFSTAAGVGDIDAYAHHLETNPPRRVAMQEWADAPVQAEEKTAEVRVRRQIKSAAKLPRCDLERSKGNDLAREKAFQEASHAKALNFVARQQAFVRPKALPTVVQARLAVAEQAARQAGFRYLDGSGHIARYQFNHVERLIDAGAFCDANGTVNDLERDKYVVGLTASNEGFVKADLTHDSRAYCAYKLEQYSRRAGFEIRGAGDVSTYLNALRLQVEEYGETLETGLAFMWERIFHATPP